MQSATFWQTAKGKALAAKRAAHNEKMRKERIQAQVKKQARINEHYMAYEKRRQKNIRQEGVRGLDYVIE